MAKTLNAKGGDNVTKLPARAAKGAGGSKPSPEPKAMKPEMPKVKRAAPTEDELREALQLRLIGLRSQHHQVDASMDVLRAELKDLNAKRKEIREAIKSTGMPLAIFDEAYYDAETSRVDLERKEHYRSIIREAYGLMAARPADLLEKVAKPAQPEVYWESQGYQDGIGNKDGVPPKDCPPEHGQSWMRGWQMAMERNAKGIKKLSEAPSDTAPTQEPVEDQADEVEADGDGFEASAEELAKQQGRPAAEESGEVLH